MNYQELIQIFFQREVRGKQVLASEIENIYSVIVDKFIWRYPQIRHTKYTLDDESIESVASQFFKFFPTHYFKAYYSLLQSEQITYVNNKNTNFIGWPGSTLVDIGCGTGAVSIAYLSILLRYQQFLTECNKSISPVDVCLIGVDTNENMLAVYQEIVERISKILVPYLIRVQFKTVKGAFPNEVNHVFQLQKPNHPHYVLLALSNIVKPLDEMFNRAETVWSETIAQTLLDEPRQLPSFGMAESRAIETFLNEWQLDQLGILGIATKGSNQQGKSWYDHLGDLSVQITNRLAPNDVVPYQQHDEQQFRIVNPEKSYWKSQKAVLERDIRFSWGYLHITSENSKYDEQWQKVLEYSNLELAWSRARQYALREALTDETEIKLFDIDTELKLMRLRAYMLMKRWDCLNIKWMLQYGAPKTDCELRPKTIARMEEQILSTALIQTLGHNVDRGNSYSYRLKKDQSEFLYEYWLHAWKEFIAETHKQAESKKVLRADIKDFYKNIDQRILFEVAITALNIQGGVTQLLDVLIKRDCGDGHNLGYGLPQGHIASGFWADIYLGKLDKVIRDDISSDILSARYADDMVFALEDAAEDVKTCLDSFAQSLKLNLSDSKTYIQSGEDYIESTELDLTLQKLAEERYDPLINQRIFCLDYEHWQLFESDERKFVANYCYALRKSLIYLSESWLHRKLHQNKLKAGKLQWPEPSNLLNDIDLWLSEFLQLNQEWLNEVDKFRNELAEICLDSFSKLQETKLTAANRAKFQRRFRFSAYRLCNLKAPDHLCEIFANELIENPWRVSARLLCPGLANANRSDLLLKIIKNTKHSYVRAISAWSLGAVDHQGASGNMQAAQAVLCSLLLNVQSTPHEKLKASEALLRFDNHEYLKFEWLTQAIDQENNPYLIKNYILLLDNIDTVGAKNFVRDFVERSRDLIVIDAIQSLLFTSSRLLNMQSDPDTLKEYYSTFYPIAEADSTMTEIPSPPDTI